MATVLVVDDDPKIRELIRLYVEREGHRATFAADGPDALAAVRQARPDLVLLDVMLPGIDGFEVCRRIDHDKTKVVMLSARDDAGTRDQASEAGADAYLTKPFSAIELLARIRALLRRRAPEALDSAVEVGALTINPATRRVTSREREVKIGATEFKLLHFLMTHPERVHSRAQLLDRVWGDHVFIEERTVDVHVKRLREALAAVACQHMIETVRGAGYRLTHVHAATA